MSRGQILMGMLVVVVAAGIAVGQEENEVGPGNQERHLMHGGPLGLPSIHTLQKTLSLTDAQVKKCEQIYADFRDKAREASEKSRNAEDKKSAHENVKVVKGEIVGKLREVCANDDQRKALDGLVAPPHRNEKTGK